MKIEYNLIAGARVLRIDSETEYQQKKGGLYLSVTSHYRPYKGKDEAQNIFVKLDEAGLRSLRTIVDSILETTPTTRKRLSK